MQLTRVAVVQSGLVWAVLPNCEPPWGQFGCFFTPDPGLVLPQLGTAWLGAADIG